MVYLCASEVSFGKYLRFSKRCIQNSLYCSSVFASWKGFETSSNWLVISEGLENDCIRELLYICEVKEQVVINPVKTKRNSVCTPQ
jgi:hypothetical protein